MRVMINHLMRQLPQIIAVASVARIERQRNPGSANWLAEAATLLPAIAAPVSRQQPSAYITVERRVRPVGYARGKAVLHRSVMDVVNVSLKIAIVADGVLPKSTLPERGLSIGVPTDRRACCHYGACEATLEQTPPNGEVGILFRQGLEHVQMVGQHHDRFDAERRTSLGRSEGASQQPDMLDQHARFSIGERGGDEKRAACNKISPVSDHAGRISRISLRSIRATLAVAPRKRK